jgi:hypothetical protein
MLETISLGKVIGRCEGAEVGLETINVESLDNTSVEMSTGNIVLVMSKGAVSFDVEEDEVTRLVDVLCCSVSGGNSLELN